MDWLTITTTLIAAIAPSIISIYTIKYQLKMNKENNEQQMKLNKQSNDYQLKQKQLELSYSNKISSLNSYLTSLNHCLSNPSSPREDYINYQLAMINSCMYVSKETYQIMIEVDDLMKQCKFSTIRDKYFNILLEHIQTETCQYDKNN